MKRSSLGIWLLILPLVLLLGFATYGAWFMWNSVGGAPMSANGVAAMVLGVVFTIALAIVLVGLLLYSERHRDDG